MARTKEVEPKRPRPRQPRKQLMSKAPRGHSQEEDCKLKVEQVARYKRLEHVVRAALKQAKPSIHSTPFQIPTDDKMMDVGDNDPDWIEQKHDSDTKEDDDAIDVEPCELASVRTVLKSLPRTLVTAQSTTTPSAIITQYITLRITETNMKWHPVPSITKKNKGKSIRALEAQDVMIHFTPSDRAPSRPELKIKGIGVPITIECFVINHYNPIGEVLAECEPSVVVNIPACEGRAAAQKVVSIARILEGAAHNNKLFPTAAILAAKYEHDFTSNGLRTSCIKCGHAAFVFCVKHDNPFCKHHYEHREGRPTATHSQYDVIPEFDDCDAECQSLLTHPSYGKKQLSCFVNMFNMFDKDETNVWKLTSQNFCADVVSGGIAIWDEDFSHFVKPTEVISRYRQIFAESTDMQVKTGARRIIDFFCFHTAYHSVQYQRCGESQHSLSVESLLKCVGTRVQGMAKALETATHAQEYVCFVMGCDLNEHAMDLRKTAEVCAHVIHFVKSPQFTHLSSFIERFRVLTLDLGMSISDAFSHACQITAVPARLVCRHDINTVVTWTREDDGIYREVWNRSANVCLLRNLAIKIQAVQQEQQSVEDLLLRGPDQRYACIPAAAATAADTHTSAESEPEADTAAEMDAEADADADANT